jgi:glycosidase
MEAIKREYPGFSVVGELFDGDPALVSFFQGGKARYDGVDSRVDTLFDFPLYYPIRRAFAGIGSIREIPQMLARDHLYNDPNRLVTFLGLHDVARFMNEKGATVEGLKLAFTALMTLRGIPLIYYGDEIAMPGGNDPDNRRDFPQGWSDTRRPWTPMEQSVLDHVKSLGRIRAGHAALRTGALTNLSTGEQTWCFQRSTADDVAIVVMNNELKAAEVACPVSGPLGEIRDVLGKAVVRIEGESLRVSLPARGAAILVAR